MQALKNNLAFLVASPSSSVIGCWRRPEKGGGGGGEKRRGGGGSVEEASYKKNPHKKQ
ncbi:hypothetical protein E2C01_080632 [Portunus trituberculatus]|uniref:Uncharacterized protein n=1 Tax=Portunus trituberculatus TaxID=210409 RepID=A0A5B7J043_PORTR|nr:hypothetical protein [Portunus trituberculatus]